MSIWLRLSRPIIIIIGFVHVKKLFCFIEFISIVHYAQKALEKLICQQKLSVSETVFFLYLSCKQNIFDIDFLLTYKNLLDFQY